jgi:hypothetical protein
MASDGRWQWDDENNTDLPIATTALVSGQQDYTIAVSHLQIERVEVQSTNSAWTKLVAIDQADVYNQALENFPIIGSGSSQTGAPQYYDMIGNSIFLYPSPNYSQAASLKLWFKRGPSYFTTADTTKSPGFNTLYHELIPLWIAYNFAIANGKANATIIYNQILSKEDALRDDYSVRNKDDLPSLQARPMRWN